MSILLCRLLLAAVFSSIVLGDPYCTTFPVGDKPEPEGEFLPNKFSTRVEITVDGKISSDLEINFDYDARKAAITTETLNMRENYIFDYDTNEVHVVTSLANMTSDDGNFDPSILKRCETYSLTETNFLNDNFGVVNETTEGGDWRLSPKAAYNYFHFGDFPKSYLGVEYIRGYNSSDYPYETSGIRCDVWISCEYDEDRNFTVTNYIANSSSFNMPFPNPDNMYIPVRTVIKGVRLEESKLIDFEEYHEYYNFKAGVTKNKAFQTPQMVYCDNRKMTQTVPDLLSKFKYSREQTINGDTTHLKDVVYDGENNGIKYEMRPSFKDETEFYVTDRLYIIHDYNIGVAFTRNLVRSNCSITPISIQSFDEDSQWTDKEFQAEKAPIVKLKSPKSLFGLDSDYIYTGKRAVNNIPADIYISDRSQAERQKIYSEFGFGSSGFEFATSIGNLDQLPIRAHRIFADSINSDMYINYYGFDILTSADIKAFDTSECFNRQEHLEIRLTFPFKDITTKETVEKAGNLAPAAFNIFVTKLNESFTRFTLPRLSTSFDGNLYMRLSILPRPPPMALFTLVPGKWLISPSLDYHNNVKTVEECANYCVADIKCLSFDYSTVIKRCFINLKHASDADLNPQADYSHYSRNTLEGKYSRPSSDILALINQLIQNKEIKLQLTSVEATDYIELNATSIIVLNDDGRTGLTALLSNYDKKFNDFKMKAASRSIAMTTLDECARLCNEELIFECVTFDFCYVSGECRLSLNFTTESDVVNDGQCDIYEKSLLFHYKKFPGIALISKEDKVYQNVFSPVECAKKCNNELSIHCRSFNFCQINNECTLSSVHTSDNNETTVQDLICQHYSRDYLADFLYTSTADIYVEGDLVFTGATVEKCSEFCVSADGFECKSFNYCPNSKTCLLNKGLIQNITRQIGVPRDVCRNYKREYFFITTSKGGKIQKDNSEGILTALAFSFTFMGLAMGACGVLVYNQSKKNKN